MLLGTFKIATAFCCTKSSPIYCVSRMGGFESQLIGKSSIGSSTISISSGISISTYYLSVGISSLKSICTETSSVASARDSAV